MIVERLSLIFSSQINLDEVGISGLNAEARCDKLFVRISAALMEWTIFDGEG